MWQAGMKAGYKYIADLNALNAEQYLAIRQMTYSFCWSFLILTDISQTFIENVSHCYL